MSGGCFQGAIFDVDGVLVGSPHEFGEGRLVAFADVLRFVLAVKQAGFRVVGMSGPARNVPQSAAPAGLSSRHHGLLHGERSDSGDTGITKGNRSWSPGERV